MSYEGRLQLWCKKGHYSIIPDPYDGPRPRKCQCGERIAFTNPVDDTNFQAHGFIEPVELTPAVPCTCSCCGNTHVRIQATFQIPSR